MLAKQSRFTDVVNALGSDVFVDEIQKWSMYLLELQLEISDKDQDSLKGLPVTENTDTDASPSELTLAVMHKVTGALANVLQKVNRNHYKLKLKLLENTVLNLALNSQTDSVSQNPGDDLVFIYDIFLSYVQAFSEPQQEVLMCDLFEVLTSADEAGLPRMQTLNVHFTNLLGTVFGVSSPETSSQILKYGSYAFRSKHRKSLLGESLFFISKVCQLFETDVILRSKLISFNQRIQAICEVTDVIDEVLIRVFGNNDKIEVVDDTKGLLTDTEEITPKAHAPESVNKETALSLIGKTNTMISTLEDAECKNATVREVVHSLLQLACTLVKFGESIAYTFSSVLPNLFNTTIFPDVNGVIPVKYFCEYPKPKGLILWNVDKKLFAKKLLRFCQICLETRVSSPFHIFVGLVPKLVKNINKANLSDHEKMSLLIDFISNCMENSTSEEKFSALISNGIDIISMIMPLDNIEKIRTFLYDSGKIIAKLSGTTSLFLLKLSCDFMLEAWPRFQEDIKVLFLKLLLKNNRDDIRSVHSLCHNWLLEENFAFVLDALRLYSKGKLKSRDLQRLTENILTAVNLRKQLMNSQPRLDDWNGGSNGLEGKAKQKSFVEFIGCIIGEINTCLESENISAAQLRLKETLAHLSLYNILFHEDLVNRILENYRNLINTINTSMFPEDVRGDPLMMATLEISALRINSMQLPRYTSLKKLLIALLQLFLNLDLDKGSPIEGKLIEDLMRYSNDATLPQSSSLMAEGGDRLTLFESIIQRLFEKNKEIKSKLCSVGYSLRIWNDPVLVSVTTEGSLNTEENHRQTLLACFLEYTAILRQLAIKQITFDGKKINTEDIFSDDLPLLELKGRRAAVVREIERQCSKSQTHLIQRKFALLAEEERIESNLEQQAAAPTRPRSFSARLNVKFVDCAGCCGPQIVGCYAPTGEHCERPLEIGFRADSGIMSIYDEKNLEIENAEVLFTEQGMYVFKSYSTGHPYDTSKVWIALFKKILDDLELVPAIILPLGFPNRHTWEEVRTFNPAELTGTILQCDFDFSNDWRTYYDDRPESIRPNKDIVLQKGGFCRSDSTSYRQFHRQVSFTAQKDLGGLVFNYCMERFKENEFHNEFRFLGTYVALYLNHFLEHGEQDLSILDTNFDHSRWSKSRKNRNLEIWSKENILCSMEKAIYDSIISFIASLDLDQFCVSRRKQFFQLREFVAKVESKNNDRRLPRFVSKKLLKSTLKRNICFHNIESLPENVQESLMHWIYSNEDRVWRYRGGRDEYETLGQYLNLLPHLCQRDWSSPGTYPPFPGVLACLTSDSVTIKDIVGYAVGEYVALDDKEDQESKTTSGNPALDRYEIITVWVDKRYRGLNIASKLYTMIFDEVHSPYVMFDIINGSLDKIIKSNALFGGIQQLGLTSLVIEQKSLSYQVETVSGEEQFERLVVRRFPIVVGLNLIKRVQFIKSFGELICIFLCIALSFLVYAILYN